MIEISKSMIEINESMFEFNKSMIKINESVSYRTVKLRWRVGMICDHDLPCTVVCTNLKPVLLSNISNLC